MSANLDKADIHYYISRIALARAIKSMDEGQEELWKASVIFNQPFVKKLLAYHQASTRKSIENKPKDTTHIKGSKTSFPSNKLDIRHQSVEINTKVTMREGRRQDGSRNNSNHLYSPVVYYGHHYDAQVSHHDRYHSANPSLMMHHKIHYRYPDRQLPQQQISSFQLSSSFLNIPYFY